MTTLSSALEPVLKTALIGTGRDANPLRLEAPLNVFGAAATPETALLNAAAALALCSRAGVLPAHGEAPAPAPAPAVCPAETRPYFSRRAVVLLDVCLNDQRDLVPQVLQWAAQSGRIAPPPLLPTLLDLGRGSRELRRTMAPILGERGRWLAQLNEDWSHVAAPIDTDIETSWRDGEAPARLEALRLQRELDPATARAWVEAEFKTASARERAGWLAQLEAGLSDADEPFLESTLDDKSKEVRGTAIGLLEKLPASRLVARAKAEAEPLLGRTGWRKTLTVELPQWNPAWVRDGLVEKPASAGGDRALGERASWLRQFLLRLPPENWEARFGATAAQIVAGAPREWRDLLFGAWWDAARVHGATQWLVALVGEAPEFIGNRFLLHGLPAAAADAVALAVIGKKAAKHTEQNLLASVLQQHPGPWSPQLARQVLTFARELISGHKDMTNVTYGTRAWWLRSALAGFADKLPVELAAEAVQGWPDDDLFRENWGVTVHNFTTRLQLRADLHAEFFAPH